MFLRLICCRDEIRPTNPHDGYDPVISNDETLLPRMGKTVQVTAVMQPSSSSPNFTVNCGFYSDGKCRSLRETNRHVQEQMKCLGVKWSVQSLLLYQSVICRIVLTTSEPLQNGAVCFLFNRFKIASVNAQKWTMKPGENDSGITAGRT